MKRRMGCAFSHLKKVQDRTRSARSLSCMVSLFVVVNALAPDEASAAQFSQRLTNGFTNCTYSRGPYTTTFTVTMNLLSTGWYVGIPHNFYSWGMDLSVYDSEGYLSRPLPKPGQPGPATSVSMNGAQSMGTYNTPGYLLNYYTHGVANWGDPWFVGPATIEVQFANYQIDHWPAIALRASFVYSGNSGDGWGNYVWDSSGYVYIAAGSKGCQTLASPDYPPPAVSPLVTMTAPDWDLGELPRGEETVLTLPATKDQLCFSYEGSRPIANQKYLINATNANGLSADGSYLLKSLEDSLRTVPYTLTLANSTDSVLLPNTQNRLFSLDKGGRTCFAPTFKAYPDKAAKGGAYSDILTFTVVAKT